MKEKFKKKTGAAIILIILVVVLSIIGGGAAFLSVRMIVSGDGKFLGPFEEIGWIEPDNDGEDNQKEDSKKEVNKKGNIKEDIEDKDEDKKENPKRNIKDDSEDDKKDDDEKENKKQIKSNIEKEYLVEESRLSAASKKSDVEHYYGKLSLADEMAGDSDEFSDVYDLMKAGINIYAEEGKVIEIEFGFDITDFCREAYEKYSDEFEEMGIKSSDDLQDNMMSMIETMFDSSTNEYSEYMTKYVEGGSFQVYVTEKGFEALYEEFDIEDGEDDLETIIDSIEDEFNTKISLVD